jgi:hypothetical protein
VGGEEEEESYRSSTDISKSSGNNMRIIYISPF